MVKSLIHIDCMILHSPVGRTPVNITPVGLTPVVLNPVAAAGSALTRIASRPDELTETFQTVD